MPRLSKATPKPNDVKPLSAWHAALTACTTIILFLVLTEFGLRSIKTLFDPGWLDNINTYSDLLKKVASYWEPSTFNTMDLKPGYQGTLRSHEFPGKRAKLAISGVGLRGHETTIAKPPGIKRVLILGDSMTFGLYVNDDETYPAVLGKLLAEHGDKVEVLNAGYAGGWCTDENFSWLVNKGLTFQPDLVIFGFVVAVRLECLKRVNIDVFWTVDSDGLPISVRRANQSVDEAGNVRSKAEGIFVVGAEPVYRIPILRELYLAVAVQKALQHLEAAFRGPEPVVRGNLSLVSPKGWSDQRASILTNGLSFPGRRRK